VPDTGLRRYRDCRNQASDGSFGDIPKSAARLIHDHSVGFVSELHLINRIQLGFR